MRCPYCSFTQSRVIDKRYNSDEGVNRRRRECQSCFKRFTTYERVEHIELNVIKKDGSIESFNREKLKKGIIKALNKRSISQEVICRLLDDVERRLLTKEDTKIHTSEIGDIVLSALKKIDSVAYLRYASVYKQFNTLDDFEKELNLVRSQNDERG